MLGAVGVGTAAAVTDNSGVAPFSFGNPACPTVTGTDPATGEWSALDIVGIRGISCAAAERVVRACVDGRVSGWRDSSLAFTTSLTNGNKQVELRLVSGVEPRCLVGRTLLQARPQGFFGPYQFPMSFPSKWPAPFTVVYEWTSPVTTYSATITQDDISNVALDGFVRNSDGAVLSSWFEYGTTEDALDQSTPRVRPAIGAGDAPVRITADVLHLKARTRYLWRAAANIRQPDGKTEIFYGTIGSFVTKPYPNLQGVANPCADLPSGERQVTERLTLECSQHFTFTNNDTKYSPIPFSVGYHGRLTCPRSDPRNLNAGEGSVTITIPEIHYPITLSLNHTVSFWRSNDSNRFTTFFGNQKNYAGSQQGPLPGWHDWEVDQWGYPFTTTSTDAQFWINCTDNWTATSGDQLATGQGNDSPSDVAPSAPQNLKAVKAADGGIDASWSPPSSVSPSGVGGYFLTFRGWKKGVPKEIPETASVLVTATGLSGHIFPGQMEVATKSSPPDYEFAVAVAAVSQEGSRGPAAVVNWQ